MNGEKKQRIILLDLLRAFAVVMMIQGHTVHSLLDSSYSNSTSLIYNVWVWFRGFTAPIFIFSSGLIFTYLLLQNPLSLKDNPRIKKGFTRGITLILIGYLLRYPTLKIFKLAESSNEQWLTFFSVDALQLIGVGLLLILAFVCFTKFIKINLSVLLFSLTLIVLLVSPLINSLKWESSFIPIASYFTYKFGSIFPLFPYLLYIFIGGLLGVFIVKDIALIKKYSFLLFLFGFGSAIILIALALSNYYGMDLYYNSMIKIGMVFTLFSIIGWASKNMESLPNYIQSLARNSLWIYIIHLIILYGSPTSIGLYQIVGKTQSAVVTIFAAVTMIILMTIISLGIDKLRVTKIKIF
ncbi:MAG: DUF1624 domain-containing protein [Melioribacteraceae bacterium]|nr:DUF1624 domain-containing protein [Melioribacteraceae bacterium]